MTHIGEHAFLYCRALEKLELPSSLNNIDANAFCHTLIPSLNIPEGVTEIKDETFSGNSSLSVLTLPASVTNIGSAVFMFDENLKTVNYAGTIDQWNAIEKSDNWLENAPHFTVICTDGEIEY